MIVYGRQEYREHFASLLARLRARLEAARAESLEELRVLLIQAGQLEQAVEDAEPEPQVEDQITRLTDSIAGAFCHAWGLANRNALRTREAPLASLVSRLDRLKAAWNPLLTVKIPEGFEYYALFPEQYCVSAARWAEAHAGVWPRRVTVVGLRSIGTTLSAVVAAALQELGWEVERLTVRPAGHPFARTAALRRGQACPGAARCHCALVVDEGPGLSGSSMAAAGAALAGSGFADISFFPGHGGEPGPASSAETRRWWAVTPRYWTPLEQLRWNGLSLFECLVARAGEVCGEAREQSGESRPCRSRRKEAQTSLVCEPDQSLLTSAPAMEDLSGGLWRKQVFAGEAEWPAVVPMLERMKLRCTLPNGCSVLWKFAGLGCAWQQGQTAMDLAWLELSAQAADHFVAAPLGRAWGFLAVPWIEGTPLTSADGSDASTLAHLGHYLTRASGPALSEAEAEAAFSRLKEMLYWNTKEALGEPWAERTLSRAAAARDAAPIPASYGDGRMAPYEWLRTHRGQLLKTDSTGHPLDHTTVGRQSLLWDAAGALVEWNLTSETAEPVLRPMRAAGFHLAPAALAFYRMAYAAFRLGYVTLGQSSAGPAEQRRLVHAAAYYRAQLEDQIRAESDKPK